MPQQTVPQNVSSLSQQQSGNFFADQLRSIYRAEKELVAPLTTMQRAVSMNELKELLMEYLAQLHRQTIRVEEIFSIMLILPAGEPSYAMEGLIKEIEWIMEKTPEGSRTRDMALIMTAQKAVHYKVAAYESLEQLAASLKMKNVCRLLHESLEDEKNIELLFAELAAKRVNWLAESER